MMCEMRLQNKEAKKKDEATAMHISTFNDIIVIEIITSHSHRSKQHNIHR